ncbi:MAG TPA: hypothetical protein VHQ47_16470 [Phycisphaerae bacterium]|nr:hypothetical protein [Phycisphaerae bacterium]
MNFVLHILGQVQKNAPAWGGRGNHLADDSLAAVRRALLAGQYTHAAELLADATGTDSKESLGTTGLTFARGQLSLMAGAYSEAAWCFAEGMERVMGAADGSLEVGAGSILEKMIGAGEDALRSGNCGRAVTLLSTARGLVDQLLGAEAGLCVAEARIAAHMRAGRVERLVPLARLGDTLLKAEARARLAGSVGALKTGGNRADVAWAIGAGRVTELLEGEFETLSLASRRLRGHAEVHLRLGLVARTLGHPDTAAWALGEVLAVHPHHVSTAARLGATLVERGADSASVLGILAVAFAVPTDAIRRYADLAAAAHDADFDQRVDRFAAGGAGPVVRANLAFALAELGLLEGPRAAWRELHGLQKA